VNFTYFSELTRNTHIWLINYIQSLFRRSENVGEGVRKEVIFLMVDHFEPVWGDGDEITKLWGEKYPLFAEKHYDSDGMPLQHTWFFPIESYNPLFLERLSMLCQKGFGEIELHLHHDNDNEESLRKIIKMGIKDLTNHGALVNNMDGKARFGFIHGNWALNNSRKDGRWCGVNDELRVLRDEGCYADFTLPSAPSDTQTKKINSIYYAKSNPGIKKNHNKGIDVVVGGKEWGDLMIIQGPLTLNWSRRKYIVLPQIENGEIAESKPGSVDRIKLWKNQDIHIKGRPEWIFIKVHCHGGVRKEADAVLGEKADKMFSLLESIFRNGDQYRLHYVTARECYNIIKAAEANEKGNPSTFRDYVIPSPQNRSLTINR
jgi:hypothetical protein